MRAHLLTPVPVDNRRKSERVDLKIRVDARYLNKDDVYRILEGEGFPDLDQPSLSRRRPREGMTSLNSQDLSMSGLALEGQLEFKHGMAFALDLHLPGDAVVVKALAEVMWVREAGMKNRAGLRIAAMHWLEMQRLMRALDVGRNN